jgi:hypothetical protein
MLHGDEQRIVGLTEIVDITKLGQRMSRPTTNSNPDAGVSSKWALSV